MKGSGVWQLWVDSGGTFTDCVAVDPLGAVHRAKVLSSGRLRARVGRVLSPRRLVLEPPRALPPGFLRGFELRPLGGGQGTRIVAADPGSEAVELERPVAQGLAAGADVELSSGEEAPVVAARLVTGTPPAGELPPIAARLASTRGTNALLEGKGSVTALFVTRGFADLLEIGSQQRPDLFALEVVKSPPLYRIVIEVDERLAADGSVLESPDSEAIDEAAARALAAGASAAAVCFLHSYRNPEHEEIVGRRLRAGGFGHVSLSSGLSSRIKILGRAQTAVVDAYLSGVITGYVARVREGLRPRTFHLMTSAAGLVRADFFRPKDALLSGPAGGVLGAAAAGVASGGERLLAFDMGGTSTDVSRFDGALEYRDETRVGPGRLRSTSVAVETVAAGGGSICSFDGRQLKVGPESAGAHPGPACYGAGGPLTLTDVNLLLGRIEPSRFAFQIDLEAARTAAEKVLAEVAAAAEPASAEDGHASGELERTLAGFLRIANEKMAAAVRRSSVRKGYLPADYWLVAFGGAGPQHACSLAGLLGISTILVPADAALLSAVGLGAARVERFAERQILEPCEAIEADLESILAAVEAEARRQLRDEGLDEAAMEVRLRRACLRFSGQEATLEIDLPARPAAGVLRSAFRRRYAELFGYDPGDRPVELESVKVLVAGGAAGSGETPADRETTGPDRAARIERRPFFAAGWREGCVVERGSLGEGRTVDGPALVLEAHSVTVVDPGWSAGLDRAGALVVRREKDGER